MRNQSCLLKRFLYLSFGILLNHVCFASGFHPIDSWYGKDFFERSFKSPLAGPLESVGLRYDRPIKLTHSPKAYIKDGQDIIVTADSVKVRNYITESKSEGYVEILFSGEILPKGKTYTFCLDSASVCLIDDISVTNSPVSYPLIVPNSMGKADFFYKNGSKIGVLILSLVFGIIDHVWLETLNGNFIEKGNL